MEIRIFRLRFPLKNAFRIAHGSYAYRENLFLELREGEAAGLDEVPRLASGGVRPGAELAARVAALRPLFG